MVDPGMQTTFPFEVSAPNNSSHTFIATVRFKLDKPEDAAPILGYCRSVQMKNDLMNGWARTNAPDYGMSTKGGPRPVFQDANDRNSPVVAYELDFQFTKRV